MTTVTISKKQFEEILEDAIRWDTLCSLVDMEQVCVTFYSYGEAPDNTISISTSSPLIKEINRHTKID